jgi:hypothetical protein
MPNDFSIRTAGRAAGEAERMTSPLAYVSVSPSVPPEEPHVFPPVAGEELEPTLRVTPDV